MATESQETSEKRSILTAKASHMEISNSKMLLTINKARNIPDADLLQIMHDYNCDIIIAQKHDSHQSSQFTIRQAEELCSEETLRGSSSGGWILVVLSILLT